MNRKSRRLLIALPFAAAALYALGHISMSRHGLDPPYAYFYVGLYLQLAAVALLAAFLIWLVVLGIRRRASRSN